MSRGMVGRNSQGPKVVEPIPGPWTGKGIQGHWKEAMAPLGKSALREDTSGLISIQEEIILPEIWGPK